MKKKGTGIIMDSSVYLCIIFVLLSERQRGIVVQELANSLSIVMALVIPLFE